MKMSLHRALAELKLIDARIASGIQKIVPVELVNNGKLLSLPQTVDQFESAAVASYTSVEDLIKRKVLIKSKLVEANAMVTVTIGEKEMTIAEAINYRNVVELKTLLLNHFKAHYKKVMATYISNNEKIKEQAMKNAEIMLGKDTAGAKKPTDEDVKALTEPFIARHKVDLVDPLKLEKKIEELETEINQFNTEIDYVLSEANSTTFIEIPD